MGSARLALITSPRGRALRSGGSGWSGSPGDGPDGRDRRGHHLLQGRDGDLLIPSRKPLGSIRADPVVRVPQCLDEGERRIRQVEKTERLDGIRPDPLIL